MDALVMEWGNALVRWTHIVAAMAWIGASFFFMHLDATLRPDPAIPAGKGGTGWQVHGGGFYEMRKFLVAPAHLPAHLVWHKWQSYATWLSGFTLLCWLYYAQSSLYLVDPAVLALPGWAAALVGIVSLVLGWAVYDFLCKRPQLENQIWLALAGLAFLMLVTWGYALVFSGRGALIHAGALMATIMSGNVAMIIIPNQKKVIATLLAGGEPDAKYGKQAKQRSVHNNYLTLPVILLMVSNHYPLATSAAYLPLFVGLITLAGALVRHFFNGWHAEDGKAPWWCWGAAALAMAGAIALTFLTAPGRVAEAEGRRIAAAGDPAKLKEVAGEVLLGRCSMCHARQPVWEGIAMPPKGIVLESYEDWARASHAIRVQAVLGHAMPPNNITEMTPEERVALAAWLASRERGSQ